MVFCTIYISFFSGKEIRGLADLMDLGIQFQIHDTYSVKTEILSRVDAMNGIKVPKEKIFFGIGNYRTFTREEAESQIGAVLEAIHEKYPEEVNEERYSLKNIVPTE